jgi:hypothetical protein
MADFPDPANTLPPSAAAAGFAAQQHYKTPFWERVLSPLLFISFILGLYTIDNNNRDRTTSSMSSGSDWDDFALTTSLSSRGSNGKVEKGRPRTETVKEEKETKQWFWRAKKRRLAKMEIADALESRGTIALALVVFAVTGLILAAWTGNNMWQMAKERVSNMV